MAGRFGTAAAGSRTISDPCDIIFCSGAGDGEAWWAAGETWAMFTRELEKQTAAAVDPANWSPELKIEQATAGVAFDKFVPANKPWIVFKSNIVQWAEAQQTLRDYASSLADLLEKAKGLKIKAPADAPPAKSLGAQLEGLVQLGGIAVALWFASKLISKDS